MVMSMATCSAVNGWFLTTSAAPLAAAAAAFAISRAAVRAFPWFAAALSRPFGSVRLSIDQCDVLDFAASLLGLELHE